jgi:hypothetical protein
MADEGNSPAPGFAVIEQVLPTSKQLHAGFAGGIVGKETNRDRITPRSSSSHGTQAGNCRRASHREYKPKSPTEAGLSGAQRHLGVLSYLPDNLSAI